MTFKEYKLELHLAYNQHPRDNREEELYSIIAAILRETYSENIYNKKLYSIRDVHLAPYHRNNLLYGKAGYPDLVIFSQKLEDDRDEKEIANIWGAVEIKAIGLIKYNKDKKHILGEIDSFKKVLYTNGLFWIFYDNSKKKVKSLDDFIWKVNLYETSNIQNNDSSLDLINNLSFSKWKELLSKLRSIKWEPEN